MKILSGRIEKGRISSIAYLGQADMKIHVSQSCRSQLFRARRCKVSAATLITSLIVTALLWPNVLCPPGHLPVAAAAASEEDTSSTTCSSTPDEDEDDADDTSSDDEEDEDEDEDYDREYERVSAFRRAEGSSGARATDPDDILSAPGDTYKPPPYSDVWKMSDFIVPPLRPGELKMLRWSDEWFEDKRPVQNYAARIGLPKHTVAVLRKYASDLEMLEEMIRTHYDGPLEPGTGRFHVTPAVHSGGHSLKWYIQRPGAWYASDMHWFGCADERTHESFLRALAEAGIDLLLDAVAEEYELDGLAVQGVGFVAATHAAQDGHMHWDWSKTGGRAFNILIPLEQVPESGPELYLADDTYPSDNIGEIKLHPNWGLLLGDDSWHKTHQCDHRPSGKVRATVSIYFAELTPSNVDLVSADVTAVFPLPHSAQWLWTQRDRHWSPDGASLVEDVGRRSFRPVDKWPEEVCEEKKQNGLCEVSNAHKMRTNCAVTCNVYLTDEEYQLGVPRSKVFYSGREGEGIEEIPK